MNHNQKVFEIGENSRLGACTWGSGTVGKQSHRTILARLSDEVDQVETTVEEAAKRLQSMILSEDFEGVLGYYVGGWDPRTHNPRCYHLVFENQGGAKTHRFEPMSLGQARFSGRHEFFTRVFYGADARLKGELLSTLKRKCKDLPEGFESVFEEAFEAARAPLVTAGFQDLPIREAIDFVYSYLHITVKAHKFRFGPPVCGGPIEIGFISSDRRFRWVSHKDFGSAIHETDRWP
jgi:hypothetical protein